MNPNTYEEILEWHFCGKVNDLYPIAKKIKGVYIWIYKSCRVVYVGTSYEKEGIAERIKTHLTNAGKGLCSIFNPKEGQDILELMTYPHEKFIKNEMIIYLSELSKEKLIWIPNDKLPSLKYPGAFYRDHFLQNDDYKESWLDSGAMDKFFSNCDVWACDVTAVNSEFLETQLQIAFGNHTNKKMIYIPTDKYQQNQNWLGKQEKKEEATTEKLFGFKNYPIAGSEEIEAFKNLQSLAKEYINKQWFDRIVQ